MNANPALVQNNVGLATYHAARAELFSLGLTIEEGDSFFHPIYKGSGAFWLVLGRDGDNTEYWVAGEQSLDTLEAGEYVWHTYYSPTLSEVASG